ncbi:hypothetical protein [Bacillus sp. MSP13]|uniref:hypothetical protein n=1 Tax=Bacillus sp. MSP13 TaxID=1071061 RepID=UPI00057BE9DE|nr:hypothetical protein [Bacillus sp. MSP13]
MKEDNLLDIQRTLKNALDLLKKMTNPELKDDLSVSVQVIDQMIDKNELKKDDLSEIKRDLNNALDFFKGGSNDLEIVKELSESVQKVDGLSQQLLTEKGLGNLNQQPDVFENIEKRFAEIERMLKSIEVSIQGSGKNEINVKEEFEKILEQLKELVTKYVDQLKSSLEGKVDHIKAEANHLIASKVQNVNQKIKDLSETIDKTFPLKSDQQATKELAKAQSLDKTKDISEKNNTEQRPGEKKGKYHHSEVQPVSKIEKENEGLKTFLKAFKERYPNEFNNVLDSMNQAIQSGDKTNDLTKNNSLQKKTVVEEKEVLEL